jgi:flavin prenyltransferase
MNAARKAAPRRLIVAMTGASGSVYGIRILERLRDIGGWETHLVVSEAGVLNAFQEYGMDRKALHKLADVTPPPSPAAPSSPPAWSSRPAR